MSMGPRSSFTSPRCSSISLPRRSFLIASSSLKTQGENSPISTSSCTWGRPKCAPHLSKRRWINVSRSHGPDEFLDPRDTFQVRGKTYGLRPSETQTLSELGKFRAVAISDLREFAYQGDRARAKVDVKNLIRQGLVSTRKFPHPENSPRRLLTLTKRGHRLLLATKRVPNNQAIHHGFAKPREAHHDADLYR